MGIMCISKHQQIVGGLTRMLLQANEQIAKLQQERAAQEKEYLALAEEYDKVRQKRDSRGRYTKRKR